MQYFVIEEVDCEPHTINVYETKEEAEERIELSIHEFGTPKENIWVILGIEATILADNKIKE